MVSDSTAPSRHRYAESTSSATPLWNPPSSAASTVYPRRSPTFSRGPFSELAPVPAAPKLPSPRRSSFDVSELHRGEPVPPAKNTLSAGEKRDLVWRSLKLKRLFGVPVEESAVEEILARSSLSVPRPEGPFRRPSPLELVPSLSHRRSFPPPSPGSSNTSSAYSPSHASPLSAEMLRAHSSPVEATHRRPSDFPPSDSAPLESPPSSPSPYSINTSIPNSSAFSALGGTPEQQRDERRRKLQKLRRLLGEKVPPHLALNEMPGRVSGASVSMGRSSSRLGGMLKGAGSKLGFVRKDEGTKDAAEAKEEELIVVDAWTPDEPAPKDTKQTGGIKGLEKARKLEQVHLPNYRGAAWPHTNIGVLRCLEIFRRQRCTSQASTGGAHQSTRLSALVLPAPCRPRGLSTRIGAPSQACSTWQSETQKH